MVRRSRGTRGRRARGAAATPARALVAAALACAAIVGGRALSSGWLGTGPVPILSTDRSDPSGALRLEPTEWDAEAYPDYYRVVGPAVVEDAPGPGEARYEGLDRLGRAGRVVATVTPQMAEAGSERERADLSELRPAGWGHNEEVSIPMATGPDYHGYLFNRSHLLAKSLGGSDDLRNLVTGTRTQNVGDNRGQDGGMAYTEGLARDWLRANPDGTLYYAATPVYVGSELLPRSVYVDVRSSDGEIDLEVEVFNAVAGFEVDYATGSFSAA